MSPLKKPSSLRLSSPLGEVKGVGKKFCELLEKYGMVTVNDLLLYFPGGYIDFFSAENKRDLESDLRQEEKRVYKVEVESFRLVRNYSRRLSILTVKAYYDRELLEVVFFNKPYLGDELKKSKELWLYGRVEKRNGFFQLTNPLTFTGKNKLTVIPLYKNISTLKAGKLRQLMENIFSCLEDDSEFLPASIIKKYSFPPIVDALREIHAVTPLSPGEESPTAPLDYEKIAACKQRFIYGELFFFQLELQAVRRHFSRVKRIHKYKLDTDIKELVKSRVDFQLTTGQQQAFEDICSDLQGESAMQRLLQGDVGCGKTVVAFLTLLLAKENGYQGAFLVPTEILALQHFENGLKFFKDARIELLTGCMAAKERRRIREALAAGEIDILIGTHALLHEEIKFRDLSMVVIDEQHRFGVSQRAALYYKGRAVDLLVTTATPIPRTMLLTIYNDLSISAIKTMPAGRKPIKTRIVGNSRREEFYLWLKEKIVEGEKAYIILPLIEKSDFFAGMHSIEEESAYFKELFTPLPLGIVTGKTPGPAKEAVLADFASGKIRVLLSTTVIEVGIDVADATIISIENADRYGLAQLHQLRGRVGRGEKESFCFLHVSPNITDTGKERLKATAATADGFEIAEMDLNMRGGGLISGLEQSGYFDFKVSDSAADHESMSAAVSDAGQILADPELQNERVITYLRQLSQKIKYLNFS